MSVKTKDKRKIANTIDDDTREKMMASLSQLNQVVDIVNKLANGLKQQIEAIPNTDNLHSNQANKGIKEKRILH